MDDREKDLWTEVYASTVDNLYANDRHNGIEHMTAKEEANNAIRHFRRACLIDVT